MKLIKIKKSNRGASLIEIIIAIGIFTLIAPAIVTMVLGSHTGTLRSEKNIEATALAQQAIEAARSIRDYNWNNLSTGTHGLTRTNGYWEFSGSSDENIGSNNAYDRTTTVNDIAAYKKEIIVTVTWDVTESIAKTLTMTSRLTNWTITSWIQTLLADFDAGTKNSVETTNTGGGEVQLANLGDWADASVLLTEDFDGDGNVNDIFIENNILFVVTEADGSGEELLIYDISDISNSNVTEIDTMEIGIDINAIYVSGNYAYLATDDNDQEVTVVRLSDLTTVNTIDLPGNDNALSIYVDNNKLFVGTDEDGNDDELFVHDVSSPEGTLTELATLEIDEDVNGIYLSGDYAYLATAENDKELIVFKISTYTEVNDFDLDGNADALSIFVDGTDAYLGRDNSGDDEFYHLDISSPEGVITESGSTEIGDEVNDIYIEGGFAYLATNDGDDEEVQVIDLSDYSIEAYIDLSGDSDTKAIWVKGKYIYAGSNHGSNTLQVAQGGAGGWATPELLDSDDIDEDHNANDIFIDGDYAYVVTQNNGGGNDAEFYIYNISTPSNIILSGDYDVGSNVNAVHVSGDYAYLATDNNSKELLVLDISNKANPSEEGSYDKDGNENALSVFVSGTNAYLGIEEASGAEFYKIDVSTPSSPSYDGEYEVDEDVNDIYVNSNSAYLSTNNDDGELLILSVESDIYEEDSYDISSDPDAQGIYYSSNTVYLVTEDDGGTDDFYIFDVENNGSPISDWSRPKLVGDYDSDEGQNANDIIVSGDYAYIVTENNSGGSDPEFYIVDISTPGSPSLTGSLDLGTSVNDIHIAGNYAYLATDDDDEELIVVDISTKSSPSKAGSYDSDEGKDGYSVFAIGTTVYLGTDNNGGGGDDEFYVLNASNPASISLLGSYDVTDDVNDIYVNGDYAYIASNDNTTEFLILDISTPGSISEEDHYNLSSNPNAEGIYYASNTVYLVTEDDGGTDDFYIFDVSDPADISLTGSEDFGSTNNNVTVNGNYAYLATNTNSEGLKIIDISTPASPSEYGTFDTDSDANGVAFDGTYAYMATEEDDTELQIIGPSTTVPDFITLTGSVDLASDNNAVTVSGDYAYVGTDEGSEELTLVDISTPSSPSEYSNFDAENDVNGVAFDGTYAYLASDDNDKEIQVVGPNTSSSDYALWGTLTSSTFDSTSSSTSYSTISWTESGTGTIKFQIKTANTEVNLGNAIWVGSDGTNSTYYTSSGTSITTDPSASGTRWIQYQVTLESSDGSQTPVLEDVTIEYTQ